MCTSRIETFTVNEHGSTGVVLACTTIGDAGRGTTRSPGDAERHHGHWTQYWTRFGYSSAASRNDTYSRLPRHRCRSPLSPQSLPPGAGGPSEGKYETQLTALAWANSRICLCSLNERQSSSAVRSLRRHRSSSRHQSKSVYSQRSYNS